MDEIVVAQNKYISSKRASRLTGYAQDYIGQLVRLRKVSATKVGKAWFVDEAGLMRHVHSSTRLTSGGVKDLAAVSTAKAYRSTVTAGIDYPLTWKPITYITDDSPLTPLTISDSRDMLLNEDSSELGSRAKVTNDAGELLGRHTEIEHVAVRPVRSHRNAPVSAVSMDGIRFHTPEMRPESYYGEVLVSTEVHSLPAPRSRGTAAVSFALRVAVASVVGAVLIFFVPIVG